MLPARQPHPVRDPATAAANGRSICQPRGYCGPFVNGDYYDAFPEPLWHGTGECVHCRNAVDRAREEAKRALALRGFRQVREPAPSRPASGPAAAR